MTSRLRQAVPHSVMLVGALLLYWAAAHIDADAGGGSRLGPAVWPKAIIVFMGILCAWEIAKRLFFSEPAFAAEPSPAFNANASDASSIMPPTGNLRRLAGGIALVAGYAIAVSWLGFFLTTALFLAAFPMVGGLRRPALAALLGIAGSFVLVVLFMRIAYISLPLGEGPFRALSIGLLRLIGVSS